MSEEMLLPEEFLSEDESRRRFVVENGSPYVIGIEDPPPISFILEKFVAIEAWLKDGTVPPPPEDRKSKFSVVKKDRGDEGR